VTAGGPDLRIRINRPATLRRAGLVLRVLVLTVALTVAATPLSLGGRQ
jgi:hypothetical protein